MVAFATILRRSWDLLWPCDHIWFTPSRVAPLIPDFLATSHHKNHGWLVFKDVSDVCLRLDSASPMPCLSCFDGSWSVNGCHAMIPFHQCLNQTVQWALAYLGVEELTEKMTPLSWKGNLSSSQSLTCHFRPQSCSFSNSQCDNAISRPDSAGSAVHRVNRCSLTQNSDAQPVAQSNRDVLPHWRAMFLPGGPRELCPKNEKICAAATASHTFAYIC